MGIKNLFNRLIHGHIDRQNRHGETRLNRAAQAGSTRLVKQLLAEGANPDIPDRNGVTPLHWAAHWGEDDIVKALLQAGANPNAGQKQKWTPLHCAALSGGMKNRQGIISRLVTAGGKLTLKDKRGKTPVDYMAMWEENPKAAAELRDKIDAMKPHDFKSLLPDFNFGGKVSKKPPPHTPPPKHSPLPFLNPAFFLK